jgi:LysM repeat protein
VKELAPLGPLGEISKEYLDSFKTGIPMTRIIKTAPVNNVSTYFFLSEGKKYLIASCDQATNIGLDCTKAVTMTQVQLDALPTGPFRPDITGVVKSIPVAPAKTSYFLASSTKKYPVDCAKSHLLGFSCTSAKALKTSDLNALATIKLSAASLGISSMISLSGGAKVYLQNGKKREVLDAASQTAEGIPTTAPSPLDLEDFDYLPWGPPIAIDGSLFASKDLGADAILIGGQIYQIDSGTRKDIDFTKLFRASTGTLSSKGLSKLPKIKPLTSVIVDETNKYWMLTKRGKTLIDSSSSWINSAARVSNAVANKFPTSDSVIADSHLIKADGQVTVYLLKDGALRATYNEADRVALQPSLSKVGLVPVSISGMSFIPKSVMVLPVGLVVTNAQTGVKGIIDSPTSMISFDEKSMKLKLDAPRVLRTIQLLGYPSRATLGPFKVFCSGRIYVAANSLLHETQTSDARELPGVSTKLRASTCALLTVSDKKFGRYIGHQYIDPISKKTIKKAYKIVKGKRLPFKNLSAYKADNKTDIPLIWVDDAFVKNLPLGTQKAAREVATPKPVPVVKPRTYKVVAGDTLTLIAAKFKVTVAKLMALNKLSNSNQISIGQVLKLS